MKAVVTSHPWGRGHYEWRYRILNGNGESVYQRDGFNSWDRAVMSLCIQWPLVELRVGARQ